MEGIKNPVLLKELADDMCKVKASLSKLSDDEIKYQLDELLEQRRQRWISHIKDLYSLVGGCLKKLADHIDAYTSVEYIPLLWTILTRLAPDALSKAKVSSGRGNLFSTLSRIREIYDEESSRSIAKLDEQEREKNVEFLSSCSNKQYKISLVLLLFVEKEEYQSCLTEKEKHIIQERILNALNSGSSVDIDEFDNLVKSAKQWLQHLDQRSSMHEQYRSSISQMWEVIKQLLN
nr:hypothetical transcript [Hymenolepis microstoma]